MTTGMIKAGITYNPATAARRLKEGGVALLPTDTNYALGCVPWEEAVCARLYAIKQRPPEKPLTLFVRNAAEGRAYADLSPEEETLFKNLAGRFWPGPLNLIVRSGPRAPRHKYFDANSISLVCNRNKALIDLLDAVGGPLALTSANISGTNIDGLVSAGLAAKLFGDKIEVFVPAVDSGADHAVQHHRVASVASPIICRSALAIEAHRGVAALANTLGIGCAMRLALRSDGCAQPTTSDR
ncbi:L-threonylcarbamoyladenylate synthase [Verminephrobacter eiseniae]|uniref:L-threonylcarbamoyladenylate synthase n=1 Tax=Verminephrobacter eiseniae TaxID=364317 RepID=UPI002237163F|nr:L-threonylcarbamoyladenylate synthase [Verminephrobacter eiseniae]MCW5231582.1 Sua5/YciO/YrdC/YwlC family protein [Verminephrobacter eiseniae]MCW5293311.1 Sua5/YciO/YrdC/YwlC family protein [Verminephrobacter eiseniae]MCW8187535.1 Sua5/YciO/YrdC/YwlC family protein [Verminephrobacter eiseniae]MCW8225872.1 Sua5/YciO/YrdC/YwlC family protein [Verminephrobacter eiseniae]MCW8236750.1 Sua5/YciO/YrdC/YwlC family protein [Verminephrobacter eiseniae]